MDDVDRDELTASHRSWAWADDERDLADVHDDFVGGSLYTHLGLDAAHAAMTGDDDVPPGAGTTIALLDTGLDATHPAFTGAVVADGFDLVDDDDQPDEAAPGAGSAVGHGTHVAAQAHLIAPGATLLPIRVLDADGGGSLATLILGIELAVAAGADVINVSLGTAAESDVLEDLIEEAEEDGVVFVAAAGNREGDVEEYPARFNEVVAVAAVDARDVATDFTSDGDWIDVAAPGVKLLGPYPDGGVASWSGTSMAAPLVAGQAALLRSLDPHRSAEDIVDVIDATVVPVTRTGSAIGEGRIHVGASIEYLLHD